MNRNVNYRLGTSDCIDVPLSFLPRHIRSDIAVTIRAKAKEPSMCNFKERSAIWESGELYIEQFTHVSFQYDFPELENTRKKSEFLSFFSILYCKLQSTQIEYLVRFR